MSYSKRYRPPKYTKTYFIQEVSNNSKNDIDAIASSINSWANSIFSVFNFFDNKDTDDVKQINAKLAKMVRVYSPLFDPVHISSSSHAEKRPMTSSEKMMICCGFESEQYEPGAYQPFPSQMQDTTSQVHRDHFKALIKKGRSLVAKMSRVESFTRFMRDNANPVFKYAMFDMSVRPESQFLGDRFIELMGKFFITDEEQRGSKFGDYEFMTKLKIKHTLTALGFDENELPEIVKHRIRSRSRSKSRSKTPEIGGSSLRRKKRKSTKRRKS